MAGNIIPAIATTNAMTASLCVLQAFKVLRDDYDHAKMVTKAHVQILRPWYSDILNQVFLERSGVRAINSDSLRPPNPFCPICSVAQGKILVDLEHATLKDLVEDVLREQLGYGEEFSVSTDAGMIYDPDLDDNLPKKLTELNIKAESLLTIIDDADEPRVNLVLVVAENPKSATEDKAITLANTVDIPKKPSQQPVVEPEAHDGVVANGTSTKRKRDATDAGLDEGPDVKRFAATNGDGTEPIVLDEDDTGAILIDDD
jgi:ubiquitin-like 1-activating enzyme E1 B